MDKVNKFKLYECSIIGDDKRFYLLSGSTGCKIEDPNHRIGFYHGWADYKFHLSDETFNLKIDNENFFEIKPGVIFIKSSHHRYRNCIVNLHKKEITPINGSIRRVKCNKGAKGKVYKIKNKVEVT